MSNRKGGKRPVKRAASPPAPTPPVPTLPEALGATRDLVKAMDRHREETVFLLRELNEREQTQRLQEQDVMRLLGGLADALDVLERQLDVEAEDAEVYREHLRGAIDKAVRKVSEKGRFELIGRVGETADPSTHQIRETRVEPGAEPDTVVEVSERGVLYRGSLLRPAVVVTAKSEGANE